MYKINGMTKLQNFTNKRGILGMRIPNRAESLYASKRRKADKRKGRPWRRN